MSISNQLVSAAPPALRFTKKEICPQCEAQFESSANPYINELREQVRQLTERNAKLEAAQVYHLVSEVPPPSSIRVIAADDYYVIGDCYFGPASITIGLTGIPGYVEGQRNACWRHTKTEEPLESPPKYWRELPDTPLQQPGPFDFLLKKGSEGST